VKLEGRDFEDEQPGSTRLLQAPRKGSPGVASDGVRHIGSLEHVVEHVDDGGLSVGAGDGRHARVLTEQLQAEPNLGDDRDALRTGSPQNRVAGTDAGAHYDPIYPVQHVRASPEDAGHVESGQSVSQPFVVATISHEDSLASLRERPRGRYARLSEPIY
jgi:hypothetical protein